MDAKPLTREQIATTERKLDMPLDDIIKMSKDTTTKSKPQQHRVVNKNQTAFNHGTQNKALKVQRYMDSRPLVRQGVLAQRRSNFQRNQFPIATEAARKAAGAPFGRKPFARNTVPNSNTARSGAFVVQRRAVNVGFARKSQQQEHKPQYHQLKPQQHKHKPQQHQHKPQQHQHKPQQHQHNPQQHQLGEGDGVFKQRPKTLDSLFANMKEQRMRALSQQNHAVHRNTNGRQPGVPWARDRFAN